MVHKLLKDKKDWNAFSKMMQGKIEIAPHTETSTKPSTYPCLAIAQVKQEMRLSIEYLFFYKEELKTLFDFR